MDDGDWKERSFVLTGQVSATIGHNSNVPRTLAWEPLDSLHVLAAERVPFTMASYLLPDKYLQTLKDHAPNQCCHDPENLDIEAWYSTPKEAAAKIPDIYKIYCNECQCCHVRFMVGMAVHPTDPKLNDVRPIWQLNKVA